MRVAHKLQQRAAAARATVAKQDPNAAIKRRDSEKKLQEYESFLEDPSSGTAAMLFASFIVICICLSTVSFCVETIPAVENHPVWFYTELFFIAVFTCEYVARISVTSRRLWDFVSDFMNVIDLLAILPFYLELLSRLVLGSSASSVDLRMLRTLRLLRVFKFGRYSEDLKFIGNGIVQSISSFYLMGTMLTLGIVFFSSLLWLVDRGEWDEKEGCHIRKPEEPHYSGCSPYQSVPNSFWWAVTTMSTVGYGDAFPMSQGGRLVAGISMVVGILCVALPTTVLSVEFAHLYEATKDDYNNKRKLKRLTSRTKIELELVDKVRAVEKERDKLKKCIPYMQLLLKVGKHDRDKEVAAWLDMLHQNAIMNLDNLKAFAYTVAAADGDQWI